jgi:hypothetical protein
MKPQDFFTLPTTYTNSAFGTEITSNGWIWMFSSGLCAFMIRFTLISATL